MQRYQPPTGRELAAHARDLLRAVRPPPPPRAPDDLDVLLDIQQRLIERFRCEAHVRPSRCPAADPRCRPVQYDGLLFGSEIAETRQRFEQHERDHERWASEAAAVTVLPTVRWRHESDDYEDLTQ